MDSIICVLGALREEVNLIRRRMAVKSQFNIGKTDIWDGEWEGKNIVLARTGIGKNFALRALKKVLGLTNPSLIISIGYAGGLNQKLKVGDLLLPSQVLEINGDYVSISSYSINSQETTLLGELEYSGKITIHSGKLLTSDQVIDSSKVKQELGFRYNALAVDMETAALVAHANEKKIPFLSIRAISDTVEQSLLDVSSFIGSNGKVSKLKASWYALTHPHQIKNFVSMREQSQLATRNMTEFLENLLKNS